MVYTFCSVRQEYRPSPLQAADTAGCADRVLDGSCRTGRIPGDATHGVVGRGSWSQVQESRRGRHAQNRQLGLTLVDNRELTV